MCKVINLVCSWHTLNRKLYEEFLLAVLFLLGSHHYFHEWSRYITISNFIEQCSWFNCMYCKKKILSFHIIKNMFLPPQNELTLMISLKHYLNPFSFTIFPILWIVPIRDGRNGSLRGTVPSSQLKESNCYKVSWICFVIRKFVYRRTWERNYIITCCYLDTGINKYKGTIN